MRYYNIVHIILVLVDIISTNQRLFIRKGNGILSKHSSLQTFTNIKSSVQCGLHCLRNAECKSFSVNKALERCMLYNVSGIEEDGISVTATDASWEFYTQHGRDKLNEQESIKCHTQYTRENDYGNGSVHFLDRHYLNCGNGSTINYFKLQRTGSDKYRYKYRCCDIPLACKYKRRYTPYDKVVNNKAEYLDRHYVNCHNQYMTAFGLERKPHSDDIRYSYNCCELSARNTCYTRNSSYTYDGEGKAYYLDRQNFACFSGYGLAYFRLERNGGHDKWRYNYTCCKALPL